MPQLLSTAAGMVPCTTHHITYSAPCNFITKVVDSWSAYIGMRQEDVKGFNYTAENPECKIDECWAIILLIGWVKEFIGSHRQWWIRYNTSCWEVQEVERWAWQWSVFSGIGTRKVPNPNIWPFRVWVRVLWVFDPYLAPENFAGYTHTHTHTRHPKV